jgi:hypothetical protein
MAPQNKELAEVKIVADKFVKTKTGMIIYPKKDELKFAGSGYDVLYNIMIPGVNVDRTNGKVSRLGKDVSLYIDGRKVEYHEIQNLQAKEIEKIEYRDIPSGKYIQDDIAINIIVKKVIGGYFAIDGKQNLGYLKGDYNATMQVAKEKISYSFFGGHNIEKYNSSGSILTENFTFPTYTLERKNSTTDDLNNNNNQYVQFNIKSTTDKRFLVGNFSLVRKELQDGVIKQTHYSNLESINTKINTQTKEQDIMPSIELYGGYNLPHKQSFNVSLKSSYSKNKYNRDYQEDKFYSYTDANEEFYNINTSINYTKQIRNQSTLGIYFFNNYRLSDTKYTGTLDYSQHLYTNEAILNLGYMHNFSQKWTLNTRAGLSWLKYRLKGDDGVNQFTPRFNVMTRYQISQKQAITMQINTGNSFPVASSLSNVDQIIDSILIKRGNPNLSLTKIYNLGIVYNLFTKKINLQAMLIGNIYNNMMVDDYYPEGNNMIYTYRSDANIHQYIGVLSGTWNFVNNLSFKTELAFIHSKFDGIINDSHTTLRGSADLNYSWKNFMINIFAKAKEKQLTNSYIFEEDFANYGGNVRWSNTNWHVELGTNNPFSKHNNTKKNYINATYSYNNKIYDRTFQQIGYIKLIYRFNFGKKYHPENRNINTDTNSAIMKAQ